jgi:hypothetical protein
MAAKLRTVELEPCHRSPKYPAASRTKLGRRSPSWNGPKVRNPARTGHQSTVYRHGEPAKRRSSCKTDGMRRPVCDGMRYAPKLQAPATNAINTRSLG